MDIGILILRVLVGLTVAAHGAQKLFRTFGGHGVSGTAQLLESYGFRPSRPYAYLLGIAECVGGTLMALGLYTQAAAAVVIGVMTAAIIAVHLKNGFFAADGGVELPLVLAAAAATIAFTGPGSYSLDELLGLTMTGTEVALQATILGVLAGLVVVGLRKLPARVHFGRRRTQTS